VLINKAVTKVQGNEYRRDYEPLNQKI
jgi:hypothetical protein